MLLKYVKLVFKSVGRKDWLDATLKNLPEKIKIMEQIHSDEFHKMVLCDPNTELDFDKLESN